MLPFDSPILATSSYQVGTFIWTVVAATGAVTGAGLAAWGIWMQLKDRRTRSLDLRRAMNPFNEVKCWTPKNREEFNKIDWSNPEYVDGKTLVMRESNSDLVIQVTAIVGVVIYQSNLH